MAKAQTEVNSNEIKVAGKTYKRKKLTKEFLSLGEGDHLIAFLGAQKTLVTKKYPEGLPYFEMTEAETGQVVNVWANGGLRGKFTMGEVKEGMLLEIIGKGKVEVEIDDETRFVNDYEINILEQ